MHAVKRGLTNPNLCTRGDESLDRPLDMTGQSHNPLFPSNDFELADDAYLSYNSTQMLTVLHPSIW